MVAYDGKLTAPSTALGYALPVATLILCFTIFSAYTVIVKAALNDGTSPLVLAFLREIIALLVLMPYAYIRARQTGARFWIAAEDWGWLVLLGFLMVWCVQLLSALALKAVSALNYALLAPSVPPLCLAASLLTGYEYFDRRSPDSWLKIAGIVIASVGTVVVAVSASGAAGSASASVVVGNVLLFVNKIGIALYPLVEKKLLSRYDAVSIVAWGYATGSALTLLSVIPYLVLGDATAASGARSPWAISPSGWLAIFFAGLFTSAFNYAAMIEVNKRCGPVLVMAFYPYQAIATPILASIFLGSSLSSNDVVGGVVIVVGLALCVVAKWRERGAVAAAAAAHHSAALPAAAAAAPAVLSAGALAPLAPPPPPPPSQPPQDGGDGAVIGLALGVVALCRERDAMAAASAASTPPNTTPRDGGGGGGGAAAEAEAACLRGAAAAGGEDGGLVCAADGSVDFAPLVLPARPPAHPPGLVER